MRPLDELGKAIARSQDEDLDAKVKHARGRFEVALASKDAPAKPRRWSVAFALVAAAIVLLAVGVALLRPAPPLDVTFELESGRRGAVKEWIEAPADRELPLRFSDETTMLLSPGTRTQVDTVTPHGARVRVTNGRAAVSVTRRQATRWTFDVGPFEVLVTGTRFDIGWDARTERFELTMHDGSVKVSGPTIEGERIVVAGQKLRLALGGERDERDERNDLTSADAGSGPAPSSAPDPSGAPSAAPGKPNALRAPVPPATAPSWRELSAEGRFKDALAAADVDAICRTSGASDVLAFADVARLAGDRASAGRAYDAVRKRFAGSTDATTAAFALGRMAFEAVDNDGAIRWFSTYLRESPSGPLAREALGRQMEAHARKGDDAAAKAIAIQYLRAYPTGPHAKLAKHLSER
jgi:TolA-binding protein